VFEYLNFSELRISEKLYIVTLGSKIESAILGVLNWENRGIYYSEHFEAKPHNMKRVSSTSWGSFAVVNMKFSSTFLFPLKTRFRNIVLLLLNVVKDYDQNHVDEKNCLRKFINKSRSLLDLKSPNIKCLFCNAWQIQILNLPFWKKDLRKVWCAMQI